MMPDCTGLPPGELMRITTARALASSKARLSPATTTSALASVSAAISPRSSTRAVCGPPGAVLAPPWLSEASTTKISSSSQAMRKKMRQRRSLRRSRK